MGGSISNEEEIRRGQDLCERVAKHYGKSACDVTDEELSEYLVLEIRADHEAFLRQKFPFLVDDPPAIEDQSVTQSYFAKLWGLLFGGAKGAVSGHRSKAIDRNPSPEV
ncbi:hypothetical protein [Hyphomonas jannaschiana]|uniref:hypothetical protein n=1 Tax=Hyphomonas jannaschiana TaxID=86 RepID=UPI0012DE9B0E|nr:hypothetical protein [Hyphomonas jannaschiana]